jgi:predicted ATP-grasp superfamily ATP-dependent carboligase
LGCHPNLRSHKDSIGYPCLIKPCFSHKFYKIFNKKLFKVSDFSEALQAYDKAASAGVEVMLQEFIPGNDDLGVNYNSFFCNGRPVVEFTAQKVRLSPPGSGIPRVVINKVIPEVMQYGRDIVKGMGFEGYSCTEFKKDPRDGGYKLLEVNGRHNRSSLLSLRCGINFPWLEYNYMVNGELLTATQCDEEIYWIDEFKDFYEFIFNHRTEKLSFSAFLQPYLKKNIYANFDAGDLLPFKQRAISLFRSKIIERLKSEKFM